tara:strand:- start:1268 stop:1453 length:186 start_codon:yes stop_codon:yes gene_type:complete
MYYSPRYAHFVVSPKPETLPLPPKEWRIDIPSNDNKEKHDDDNEIYYIDKNIKYNKVDLAV